MPISVKNLLATVEMDSACLRTVRWGQALDSSSNGIYFISTSSNPSLNTSLYDKAPVDERALKFWISKVKTIEIDGKSSPTVAELEQRLNAFWLPDENIIYVGQTESSNGLRGRVNQYYNTEIGERKPHAGGHWIKTLKTLNELFVHYIPSQNVEIIEKRIMNNFVSQVSKQTREKLFDPHLPLPFANLELERGKRKNHGISKSKVAA
jgi:hypothetical protein